MKTEKDKFPTLHILKDFRTRKYFEMKLVSPFKILVNHKESCKQKGYEYQNKGALRILFLNCSKRHCSCHTACKQEYSVESSNECIEFKSSGMKIV